MKRLWGALVPGLLALACGDSPPAAPPPVETAGDAAPAAAGSELSPAVARALEPWLGDLPEMRERGLIRILVTYDKTNFFFARGRPRGFEYELLQRFGRQLNAELGPGELATRVVFLPVTFGQLLPALREGRGDIAAAGLTITPERESQVAFTSPYLTGIDELVVTAAGLDGIESLDDLAGRTVVVAQGTSYASHLRALSRTLEGRGLARIDVVEASPKLQSEDVLEMVNAGALDLSVADSHVAELWSTVLPKIRVRHDLVVYHGSRIAWAVRSGSPRLREALSAFARANRRGTLVGNVLFQRYHADDQWIRNPLARSDAERLDGLESIFRQYAERYGFDWLGIAALAYQESGLDQSRRSPKGAVGIMQILPSTAADPNVGIPDVSDLEQNVHAGVRYLAFLRDHYFSDEGISESARFDFALAAYNAGPRRVGEFRNRARALGLDPNRWFRNVEVAALELVGRETVRYVARVNKYYVAYRLARRSQRQRTASLALP